MLLDRVLLHELKYSWQNKKINITVLWTFGRFYAPKLLLTLIAFFMKHLGWIFLFPLIPYAKGPNVI